MQNIKKRTFWLLAIIGLLFTFTGCSKNNESENEMKISFANNSYEYVVGETFELNPTIQNGTEEDSELVWTIFDESVVKLVNGEFVALKEGKTIVKVASNTKPSVNAMTSIKVVSKKYFPLVEFNEIKETMQVDEKQNILPKIEGYDFDTLVTYKSLDSNVATVDDQGLVEAFNEGVTVIVVKIADANNKQNYEEYSFLIKVVETEYSIEYVLNGGKNHLENLDFYTKRQCPIVLKDATREGYKFEGWYTDKEFTSPISIINQYEEADITLYAKWELVTYEISYEVNGGLVLGTNPTEYTVESAIIPLYACEKASYNFIGWEDQYGNVINYINRGTCGNLKLTAKYEVILYNVTFDANGGFVDNPFKKLYEFAEELVKDFNSTGASDAKLTTKEKFKSTSHPNIKYVFNNAEMLAKYKWLFEFALTEIKAAAETNGYTGSSYYTNVVELLEKMIAGDTTAVGGDYADGRSIFRSWAQGLLNECVENFEGDEDAKKLYSSLMVDYSVAENIERFFNIFVLTEKTMLLDVEDELPIPTRLNYKFIGWYNGNTKVEQITDNINLTAKWAIAYTISYDLNGGSWQPGSEGPTEFVENESVVIPEPIKEGYTFVGWIQNNRYVEQIGNANYELKAKWKLEGQTGYEVIFDLNGGEFADNLDTFAEEFVAEFSAVSGTTVDRVNFKGTTGTAIKSFFNNAEVLAKYKWLFEFALSEIKAAAEINGYTGSSYYTNVVKLLEKMIAGDTTAVGGDYADGRTIFRWWAQGLLNKNLAPADSVYKKLIVDYSVAENLERFNNVLCRVERTLSASDSLPNAVRNGYLFLGWYVDGVKVDKATGDVVMVAEWEKAVSIGTTEYDSLIDALNDAQTGDTIVLKAITYTENITINKENITIIGPNENVDPNGGTRKNEAIIEGNIDVAANGFTLNGVKLSGTSTITVTSSVKTLNIKYIYSDSTGMSNQVDADHNRKSVIFSYDNHSVTNFNMSYCYFNIGNSVYLKEAVMLYGTVINANINNNYFTNSYKGTATCEALYLAQVAGTVNISNNEFIFPTKNFAIMIGEWYNDANINIENNIFSGIDTYKTAGICVRSTLAGRTVNIIHNFIYNMSGNTMDFNNAKSGSVYNIKFNYFDEKTSYKISKPGSGTINYEKNYYAGAQTTSTSDYGVINSLTELETEYNK